MPHIDMSEALLDIDMLDTFSVIRRAETVSTSGFNSFTPTTFAGVRGVVTPGDSSLTRDADQQNASKTLTVTAPFYFRGESVGYQPDLVLWGGDYFVVMSIEDYTKYGPGWTQVTCNSIDYVDNPPGTP